MKIIKHPSGIAEGFNAYLEVSYELLNAMFIDIQESNRLEENLKSVNNMLLGLEQLKRGLEVDSYRFNTLIYLEVVMLRNKVVALEKIAETK